MYSSNGGSSSTSDSSSLNRPVRIPPPHSFQTSSHSSVQVGRSNNVNESVESSSPTSESSDLGRQSTNKNVTKILAYTFVMFAARSTWTQTVLSAFIFLLSKKSEYVGFITAVMGSMQLLSSIPSGILADKYRRDYMLKIASAIGVVAIVFTSVASIMAHLELLSCALCLWGLFWGICNTTISAMFADSIHDGERSHYFTQRNIAQILGNLCGPIIALGMFTKLGDEWTASECATVMCLGQVICIPAVFLLCFMNDDDCIDQFDEDQDAEQVSLVECEDGNKDQVESFPYAMMKDEDLEGEEKEEESITGVEDMNALSESGGYTFGGNETEQSEKDLRESLLHQSSNTSNDTPTTNNSSRARESESDGEGGRYLFGCIPQHRYIPILIATADMTQGLGAGMSIRYFPIFFLDNLNLTPDKVQIIMIAAFICLTMITKVVQKLGQKYGRVKVAAMFRWIGIFLTISLVLSYHLKLSTLTICTCFILRMAAMNSTGSQTRSVLMDAVPRNERAKWSSLESVNMFSWAGSAAVGGLLVDWKGIMFNFSITAMIQLLGTAPLYLLFDLVEDERSGIRSVR